MRPRIAAARAPIAIVTGSDSGIGKATAVKLAQQGFDVGITWHSDEQGARGTAAEVRQSVRRAEVRQVDLARADETVQVVNDISEALGGLDVFVNNAGVGASTPFLDVSLNGALPGDDLRLSPHCVRRQLVNPDGRVGMRSNTVQEGGHDLVGAVVPAVDDDERTNIDRLG